MSVVGPWANGSPIFLQRERPVLCRFSDAGVSNLSTRSCGRRPKSAKARNRGELGTEGAALTIGILPRELSLRAGHFAPADGRDVHNFCVVARALRKKGDFTFCPTCDFNELGVAERARIATSGLCAWYQVFDGIDQPDF
jgi:hypothetical protein